MNTWALVVYCLATKTLNTCNPHAENLQALPYIILQGTQLLFCGPLQISIDSDLWLDLIVATRTISRSN